MIAQEADEDQKEYEDPGYKESVMLTKVEAEQRNKILQDAEVMYFLGLALSKGKSRSIIRL